MTTNDEQDRNEGRPMDAGRADADADRTAGLPEHEVDDDRTAGGGIMTEGGTATDRGTGELTGQAQGESDDDGLSGSDPDFLADEADAVLGHDQRAIR